MAFYHMGARAEYHGFTIAEHDETSLAAGWGVAAVGHLKTYRSFQIYTPEELMEALRKEGGETLWPLSGS